MGHNAEDRDRWLKDGKKQGAKYLLVVCDTFSFEDYPVFVMPNEDVIAVQDRYNRMSMQRVHSSLVIADELKPKKKKETVFALRCFRNRKRMMTHELTKYQAKQFKRTAEHLIAYLSKEYKV